MIFDIVLSVFHPAYALHFFEIIDILSQSLDIDFFFGQYELRNKGFNILHRFKGYRLRQQFKKAFLQMPEAVSETVLCLFVGMYKCYFCRS